MDVYTHVAVFHAAPLDPRCSRQARLRCHCKALARQQRLVPVPPARSHIWKPCSGVTTAKLVQHGRRLPEQVATACWSRLPWSAPHCTMMPHQDHPVAIPLLPLCVVTCGGTCPFAFVLVTVVLLHTTPQPDHEQARTRTFVRLGNRCRRGCDQSVRTTLKKGQKQQRAETSGGTCGAHRRGMCTRLPPVSVPL